MDFHTSYIWKAIFPLLIRHLSGLWSLVSSMTPIICLRVWRTHKPYSLTIMLYIQISESDYGVFDKDVFPFARSTTNLFSNELNL